MTCSVDECTSPVISRGWCKLHYGRWFKAGSTERSWLCKNCGVQLDHSSKRYCGPTCRPEWVNSRKCSLTYCDAPHEAQGWCSTHYSRFAKTGNPEKLCAGCGEAIAKPHAGRHTYCGPGCKPRCAVDGCDKAIYGRTNEYCVTHSRQIYKNGDLPRMIGTPWAEKGGLCMVCDTPVPEGARRRRYCSNACQVRASHHAGQRPKTAACQGCGTEVALTGRHGDGKLQRSDTLWCNSCQDNAVRRRMYFYGVTPAQYDAASARGCEICGRNDVSLHVDHDHSCCQGTKTCGECVRGFLCGPCNRGIGMLEEDADRMLAAAAYLLKNKNLFLGLTNEYGGVSSQS